MKYKIIDPKGVLVAGKILGQGEVIEASGAQLDAWLHFRQVEPHDEEAQESAEAKKEFDEASKKAKAGKKSD